MKAHGCDKSSVRTIRQSDSSLTYPLELIDVFLISGNLQILCQSTRMIHKKKMLAKELSCYLFIGHFWVNV